MIALVRALPLLACAGCAATLPAQQAVDQATVQDVPLPAVAMNVSPYVERPIRTCGLLQGDRYPTLSVDSGPEWYDGHFLRVAPGAVGLPPAPANVCVTGVLRRVDGISEAEARGRGLETSLGAHGLRFPGYALYASRVEAWSGQSAPDEWRPAETAK